MNRRTTPLPFWLTSAVLAYAIIAVIGGEIPIAAASIKIQ
jgi:hypothetical protein